MVTVCSSYWLFVFIIIRQALFVQSDLKHRVKTPYYIDCVARDISDATFRFLTAYPLVLHIVQHNLGEAGTSVQRVNIPLPVSNVVKCFEASDSEIVLVTATFQLYRYSSNKRQLVEKVINVSSQFPDIINLFELDVNPNNYTMYIDNGRELCFVNLVVDNSAILDRFDLRKSKITSMVFVRKQHIAYGLRLFGDALYLGFLHNGSFTDLHYFSGIDRITFSNVMYDQSKDLVYVIVMSAMKLSIYQCYCDGNHARIIFSRDAKDGELTGTSIMKINRDDSILLLNTNTLSFESVEVVAFSDSMARRRLNIPLILEPSVEPSMEPSIEPTRLPTLSPTIKPSSLPTATPSFVPSVEPSAIPSVVPIVLPSSNPTYALTPSLDHSLFPSHQPSSVQTQAPFFTPSQEPLIMPTTFPTPFPSFFPSPIPTVYPSMIPTIIPTLPPTLFPTLKPSGLTQIYMAYSPSDAAALATMGVIIGISITFGIIGLVCFYCYCIEERAAKIVADYQF